MNNLFEKFSTALSPMILLIARVVIGYLILLHGLQKLTGDMPLFSLMGVGGLIETVGGVLITIGLFTRASAFLLAGQMVVAYLMFHTSTATFFNPLANQGEPAVLFAMAFLFIFVTGAGKLSLDAKITK
ncbi:LuxR family transcriptional regulator [Actinobacillus succinogenes]|uniref:DoxX family protein n=1 Tax=Actinobacillus succinogenes (strain ATCC 55618 / DSM 22257 / CCUG 43843 / 130Z) TaxID=339671 RepID=A6VNX3_ACTSZ|nr:DoxX family protein [Actinobacillus succinogenes]ABR74670.1 DoxX family protein [Actinobacillus succinogenes 130Z]PHI40908.1 LuxR family transcriptional regulator [Actinobacillus succinogenes]